MDTRLVNLALEYADALCREVDAEVAENERAAEDLETDRPRTRFVPRAREGETRRRYDSTKSAACEADIRACGEGNRNTH